MRTNGLRAATHRQEVRQYWSTGGEGKFNSGSCDRGFQILFWRRWTQHFILSAERQRRINKLKQKIKKWNVGTERQKAAGWGGSTPELIVLYVNMERLCVSTLLSLLCWVMKPCVEFSFCSVGRWSAGRSPDYVLSLRLLTVGRYLLLFPLKVSLDITNKHLCINRISNPLLQNIQHDPTEVQFWNSSEHQLSSRLVLKCLFFYIWDSWTVDKHMSEHPLKTCFFFFIECDEMPSTVRPKQDKCSL